MSYSIRRFSSSSNTNNQTPRTTLKLGDKIDKVIIGMHPFDSARREVYEKEAKGEFDKISGKSYFKNNLGNLIPATGIQIGGDILLNKLSKDRDYFTSRTALGTGGLILGGLQLFKGKIDKFRSNKYNTDSKFRDRLIKRNDLSKIVDGEMTEEEFAKKWYK